MRTKKEKPCLLASALLALVLAGYLHNANAATDEIGSISKVNGAIRIDSDSNTGKLSTVNGSISVARDSRVKGSASTVNGEIDIGENVIVSGSVGTVNGRITLESGSEVRGSVENVNGGVRLTNAKVDGNLRNSNGDITLREGTEIGGDIIVKGGNSWWNRLFGGNRNPSELHIDTESIVHGDIHLYHEVRLRIEDEASLRGTVIHH